MIWFICGIICLITGPTCGEHLHSANGTGAQSIRTRERQQQHQAQYQYGSSKPANKQQTNRGRSNGLVVIRKNLNQTKFNERQGDDPDQTPPNRSPIHIIQAKIHNSNVSKQHATLFLFNSSFLLLSGRVHFDFDFGFEHLYFRFRLVC